MKKLILVFLFLLLSCPVFAENQQLAWMGPVIVGGVTATTGGLCSQSNDGQLYISQDRWETDEGGTANTEACQKYTVSATDDITGYGIGMCDMGEDAYNVTIRLREHVVETDEPGNIIDGTSVTLQGSEVTNCGDDTTLHSAMLSATKENIGVTTVWVCVNNGDSDRFKQSFDSTTGGRVCYFGVDCYDNYSFRFKLYGCH